MSGRCICGYVLGNNLISCEDCKAYNAVHLGGRRNARPATALVSAKIKVPALDLAVTSGYVGHMDDALGGFPSPGQVRPNAPSVTFPQSGNDPPNTPPVPLSKPQGEATWIRVCEIVGQKRAAQCRAAICKLPIQPQGQIFAADKSTLLNFGSRAAAALAFEAMQQCQVLSKYPKQFYSQEGLLTTPVDDNSSDPESTPDSRSLQAAASNRPSDSVPLVEDQFIEKCVACTQLGSKCDLCLRLQPRQWSSAASRPVLPASHPWRPTIRCRRRCCSCQRTSRPG